VRLPADSEWLEADGLGGFASGTASGVRTRRYHALLLVATTPPTGRMLLVNGFDAWVTTSAGRFALSSQRYAPGVIHPDGVSRLESFEPDPWPRWTFRLADGIAVEQEVFVPRGETAVVVRWSLSKPCSGVTLAAQPFLSGRDYHALHHENADLSFHAAASEGRVEWRPYAGAPSIVARSNAAYVHRPLWYRNFQYEAERARGLDFTEDLAAPGVFTWDLSSAEAVWILAADGVDSEPLRMGEAPIETARRWRVTEMSRRSRLAPMVRSAGVYLVQRGSGKTIVAGYPWFTDWGRDTFIALRGLCVATGRLGDARDVLLQWSSAVSAGMLPNRFPDVGEMPEYNAVDASLWFIVAVHDFFQAAAAHRWHIAPAELDTLRAAVRAILDGYMRGTRYGVRCDADGLLAAGESGVPLTWMDAKVGDSAVTPRIGKPVEVQALWLNALRIGCEASAHGLTAFRIGSREFQARFWNDRDGYLFDVVDVDHRPGTVDRSFRPNQVLAVGGLPFPLLTGARARRVIDAIEARLLTPMGLRTLAPDDLAYVSHYGGGARDRDGAYHQGTAWPWLIGPFVEGWVRVRGNTVEAKREARARFLSPLLHHLGEAGLGHISEIADGDPPHTPRGCPFQAWSLGEALRLDLAVLAE
jgi:predicted glycogen debranching enzyme